MPPMTYTLAEAAAMLGVAPGTLNVQARRGRLKAKKIGHFWTVSAAEVERYRRDVLGKPGWPKVSAE
jgi:excisionase family DNA binding protein